MVVDFLATAPQYAEHLLPVWEALEPEEQGTFSEVKPRKRVAQPAPTGDICVVASYGDYKHVCGARFVTTEASAMVLRVDPPPVPVVMLEHGAGFTYVPNPRKPGWGGSYAGGPNRHHASLFPSTNRWVQAANQRSYPAIPAPIVGCPKLDSLGTIPRPENERPTIAFSFHWNCNAHPETRTALAHYAEALPEFAREAERAGWRVLGHGHPRMQAELRSLWRQLGWEPVSRFERVCELADAYVCDTSSTIYEFAALDRPVVLLNAPWYRRDVDHGIRFWDVANVGIQVDDPASLFAGVEWALEDPPEQRELRHAAVDEVYPYLGRSSTRTVQVLRDFMTSKEDPKNGS